MVDRTVTYRFEGNVGGLVASMTAAGTAVKGLGTQMTALDARGARMRAGLDTVGSAAGRLGLVAAGGLAASAKAAIDWESDWAGVMKTVDGSGAQLQALEGDLRAMARSMPATHSEIAQVAEAAGQLGVATGDIAAFTKTMIMLGETTNLTSDEAATSIAQMANVMGTAPENIDNVGAALVALGNDGASTESQILGMAQRISAAGAQIGLTESDILAIANASASMGVEVEAGGTAISTVFTEMAKATKMGGSELEDFAETAGMSGQEFVKAFQDDPAQAFAAFTQGLNQVNESGGNVFGLLEDLGLNGVRVSQSLLGLASSGDLLTDSLDLGASAFSENGALLDEYGKRADTTASEMRVAWNNIKDAAIGVGETTLPALGSLAEDVSAVTGAFQGLPEPARNATGALLGLTAVTGGSLWFGSKVIGGIASASEALGNLGIDAGRARGLLGRLAGSAGGIIALGTALEATGTYFNNMMDNSFSNGTELSRQLEALGDGRVVGNIDRVDNYLQRIHSTLWNVSGAMPFFDPVGEAKDEIAKVDEALASMVESGNAETAAASFEQIITMADKTGVSASEVRESFDQYALAVRNAQDASAPGAWDLLTGNLDQAGLAALLAGDANEEYAGAAESAGSAAGVAASQVNQLAQEMRGQVDAALTAFDAQTAWGQAVADAQAQVDTGAKGIDKMSDAGRANRGVLSGLASAWNSQSREIKNNMGEYRNARQTFLDFADSMNVPKKRARDLADELLEVPRRVFSDVVVNVDDAINAGAQVGNILGTLDRTKATPIVGVAIGQAIGGFGTVRGNLNALDRSSATPAVNAQDNASGVIAGVRAGMAGLRDKSVTITTYLRTVRTGVGVGGAIGLNNALGGLYPSMQSVSTYAGGGFGPWTAGDRANAHQPELARGGPTRVWREPETQGEAYVPLANDYRRPRAKSILEQVADRFGGQVEWYAKGGLTKAEKKERAEDFMRAQRDFNPRGDDRRMEINKAIREFRKAWVKSGRDWGKAQEAQAKQIRQTSARYRILDRALDNNTDALKRLRDERKSYLRDVATSFDNDLFGKGTAGLQLQLEADRNDSQAMLAAIQAANKNGLDKNSGLAKALMASGDLNTAEQLVLMSRAEIDALEKLYAERAQAQNALGSYAANNVYNQAIAKQSRLVDRQEKTLKKLNERLDGLEGRLERGVARGARAGTSSANKARDRRVYAITKVKR